MTLLDALGGIAPQSRDARRRTAVTDLHDDVMAIALRDERLSVEQQALRNARVGSDAG